MSQDIDTYRDLATLMLHSNPQVKFGATNAVLSLSEDRDFIEVVVSSVNTILRNLLRNFEANDDQKLTLVSLSALLNLSGHDSVVPILLEYNAIDRLVRSLNERQILIQMHCSTLANLTRSDAGIKQALSIPNLFKGVYLKYCADSEEHTDSLGLVVINCSANSDIRQQICKVDHDRCLLIECLTRLFALRRRRLIALRVLKNLALDPECHASLVHSRTPAKMTGFLYPESDDRRSDQAPAEALVAGVGLATDIESRVVSAEILFCLTRTREGREGMRDQGIYEVVRLWHLQETDADVKERLEMVANVVHLSESEIDKGQLEGSPFTPDTPMLS